MASGTETLDLILGFAADWANTHSRDPQTIFLPVRMAWDLAKCRREDLGDLSGKVMKHGISAFETDGLLGLKVKIVREKNASLKME